MPQRMQGYTEFRGTPWPPPAEEAPAVDVAPRAAVTPGAAVTRSTTAVPVGGSTRAATAGADGASPAASTDAPVAAAPVPGRRMAGYTAFRGTPWPPQGGMAPLAAARGMTSGEAAVPPVGVAESAAGVSAPAETPDPASAQGRAGVPVSVTAGRRMAGYTAFRGTPWPPAPAPATATATAVPPAAATAAVPATAESDEPARMSAPPEHTTGEEAPRSASAPRIRDAAPAAAPRTPPATPGGRSDADAPAPTWRRRLALGVGGAVVVALLAVLGARWLMTLPAVADFVARYPGVPVHAEATPVGVPGWLAAQHFLNAFLMVLIIRTGLQVRHETRPPANFTPTRPGLFAPPGSTGKKFSLTIWMHQALDALWLLNGLVFVVLLGTTGQWRRLVPTDPATPQHMASTALQYLSLDWPAHDGWLHYNALQMVAYAGVVFVLAPLAALTGLRMSSWWPAENAGLSRAFPVEAARRVHFPVMVLFVLFIVVHVALVLLSGVLRNLNAMFLAREAADAWGLVAFLAAVAVTAGAWVLLKPAFVSPVAERFGRVGR